MKNINKNNNLPFYKFDIIEILESLSKRTVEPLNKFSYWILAQSLKNKWISPFLIDYLIVVERARNLIKKSEKSKVDTNDLDNTIGNEKTQQNRKNSEQTNTNLKKSSRKKQDKNIFDEPDLER